MPCCAVCFITVHDTPSHDDDRQLLCCIELCIFHSTFELCAMLYCKVFLRMVTPFCTELKSLMYWDVLQLCCTKSQNQIHCTFTLSCWLQHTALLHCNLHYTTLHWNGFPLTLFSAKFTTRRPSPHYTPISPSNALVITRRMRILVEKCFKSGHEQYILTPRICDSSSSSYYSSSVTEKPGLTHYPTANTLSNG